MTSRRRFITLIGSAVAAWPVAAKGQQSERLRSIGVLFFQTPDEDENQRRLTAFKQGLEQLGWIEGRNVRIDYRWGMGNPDRTRRNAAELVALAPDVILTGGFIAVDALQKATRTVPIVFGSLIDPVGGGFVGSLARPGNNTTGFTGFEYATSAKWLQLLKELSPSVTRAAVLRDSTTATGIGQWAAVQTVAPSLGVELIPINPREAGEIERAMAEFAKAPNVGLIVSVGGRSTLHRELIIALAARHRLPAIYPFAFFVRNGGLLSYGPDTIDPFRRAAAYVDRILRGEKPADLPVQAPTKYELVINLKTATALGIEVPPMLLARADEVIE
jgi:putative ABC transport system substrate-binding protein